MKKQNKSRKFVRNSLFIIGLSSLIGCNATMEDIGNRMKDASNAFTESIKEASESASTNSTNQQLGDAAGLKAAGIFDIFIDAPFDDSKKSDHQWPRVAIEVLSSPSNVNDFYAGQGISGIPDGCFEMKATIWQSASKKSVSEPFKFCFDTDIAWGVALRDYENWASRWAYTTAYRENSGNVRTKVLPPKSFVSTNVKYKRQFSNAFSANAYSADSIIGLMIFSVAAHAGIDPSISSDHRLWFTRIAPL